ncbi:hypothetical protein MM213_17430 [Belliella sp. R4-6]|uniref:cAMP-binding domain of CRP or a regulatory subunit of cAMP-dependent protein kinases n=1 Tax=Belliella alkalica TaxID=1730871 RepID=A0ABS9VFR3_9BACT|nr:hypothetical protein [Belliella alkalica]MCH7415286.1 hypothetical protein [Belliella alkalica]
MENEFLNEIIKCCTKINNYFSKDGIMLDNLNFDGLLSHLTDQFYLAGQEIKAPRFVETKSRLLLQGLVVAYQLVGEKSWKMYRVYEQGDIVVDLDSLRSGKPSAIRFQAYTKVRLAELNRKNEKKLLRNFSEFNKLSSLINQFMFSREAAFARMLSMENNKRYDTFLDKYRVAGITLKVKEIAELLNFSDSTIKRIRQQKRLKDEK